MHLSDLKLKHVSELVDMAIANELEGANRLRKQELIFALLKNQAKKGEAIFGDGTLEVLQDGFGFLRSPDTSYLAGPDDIYVSPSQIRRFNLHTGDSIVGEIRTPKDGERYFALVKVDKVNGEPPENAKNKILFENLTPLHPDEAMRLERDIKAEENLTGRVHRHHRAHRQGSARPHRLAAEGRQDGADAAHGPRHHRQPPRGRPHRAAHRRAPGGGDRDEPHRARRGGGLHLRRAGHAPRAGGRDGDREGQAPGRAQEGRGDPARLDHAPRARLQHRGPRLRQGAHGRRGLQRAAAPEALLRRRAQHRGGRIAHHHRHRADRHRLAHGRRDLRGVQGHRQHGDPPGSPHGREAHLSLAST